MSGSAGETGYDYQADAIAYIAVSVLCRDRLCWFDDVDDTPIAVAAESGGPGDDIRIEISDGFVEVQAKHGLARDDRFRSAVLRLFQGLKAEPELRGVLMVDTTSSKSIRESIRKDVVRIGEGRRDGVSDETTELVALLGQHQLDQPDLYARFRIIVLDLHMGASDRANCIHRLGNVVVAKKQATSAWEFLSKEGHRLTRARGRRDRNSLRQILSTAIGILNGSELRAPKAQSELEDKLATASVIRFRDRSNILIGRENTLREILVQVDRAGVTFIVGRPKLGKSWLLQEAARLLAETRVIVGYHECYRDSFSAILHVISSAFADWLSSNKQRHLLAHHMISGAILDHDLFASWATAMSELDALDIDQWHPVAERVFRKCFEHRFLKSLNRENDTAECVEYALELIQLISDYSDRPLCLFIDGLDQLADTRHVQALLERFIRHVDEYPLVHFVVSHRDDPQLAQFRCNVVAESQRIIVHHLAPLNIEDERVQQRILSLVRTSLPDLNVPDETVLTLSCGFPGTLERWTSGVVAIEDVEGLRNEAIEAEKYLYPELAPLIEVLDESSRRLLLRLAYLAPGTSDELAWIDGLLVSDDDSTTIDLLCTRGLLYRGEVPSFGHHTRCQAVRRCFTTRWAQLSRIEVGKLASSLAMAINDIIDLEQLLAFQLRLAALREVANELVCSDVTKILCCSASMFLQIEADQMDWLCSHALEAVNHDERYAHVVCMGLMAIGYWDRDEADDFKRQRAVRALRKLPKTVHYVREFLSAAISFFAIYHPRSGVMKQQFEESRRKYHKKTGIGLQSLVGINMSAICMSAADLPPQSERERLIRDAMLAELRTMQHQFSEDVGVKLKYLHTLVTLAAQTRRQPSEAWPFLREVFSEMAAKEDVEVALVLLRPLLHQIFLSEIAETYIELMLVKAADDLARTNACPILLLHVLSESTGTLPERGSYDLARRVHDEVMALCDTMSNEQGTEIRAKTLYIGQKIAFDASDRKTREECLSNLRRLHELNSANADVRKLLCMTLLHESNHRKTESDLKGRDQIVEELRQLYAHFPSDIAVVQNVAMALRNSISNATTEDELRHCPSKANELEQLFNNHPANEFARDEYGSALRSCFIHAAEAGDDGQVEEYLSRLRLLVERTQCDAVVVHYAWSLQIHASRLSNRESRKAVFNRLRSLCDEFPAAAEAWANAIANAIDTSTRPVQGSETCTLLDELRSLVSRFPTAGRARMWLAECLNRLSVSSLPDSKDKIGEDTYKWVGRLSSEIGELLVAERGGPHEEEIAVEYGLSVSNMMACTYCSADRRSYLEHLRELWTLKLRRLERGDFLAIALYNKIKLDIDDNIRLHCNDDLDELRMLSGCHPNSVRVAAELWAALLLLFQDAEKRRDQVAMLKLRSETLECWDQLRKLPGVKAETVEQTMDFLRKLFRGRGTYT